MSGLDDVVATAITVLATSLAATCVRWPRRRQAGGAGLPLHKSSSFGRDLTPDELYHFQYGDRPEPRIRYPGVLPAGQAAAPQGRLPAKKGPGGLALGRSLGRVTPSPGALPALGNTLPKKARDPAPLQRSVRLGPAAPAKVVARTEMYVPAWNAYKEYLADFYALPGKAAMEVGCGDLTHARGYRKFGSVVGVDLPNKKNAADANADKVFLPFSFQGAGEPWGAKKVDCMYFMDSLHNVWDGGKVCARINGAVLQGGFVVVLTKKAGNRTVKDDKGQIVLKIVDVGDGKISVTRRVNGSVVGPITMAALNEDVVIKTMGDNKLGLIHRKTVSWPKMSDTDKALANAFTVLVFAKHIPLINKLQASFSAAGIDHYAIPGGTSFSIYLFKRKLVAPTWLASISDVDTHCRLKEANQLGRLWKELAKQGITMNAPSMGIAVGAIYTLHRDVTKELDLSTALKPDPADAYLKTIPAKGFYQDDAVRMDLYCMFYLAYTAMFMPGDPSHTRGQKLARLAGKMFCLANLYEREAAALTELDRGFQKVVDQYGRSKGPAYAAQKEYYFKNRQLVDGLCRAAFQGVDVARVAETLRVYMPANMGQFKSASDYDKARRVIQAAGADSDDFWDNIYDRIPKYADPTGPDPYGQISPGPSDQISPGPSDQIGPGPIAVDFARVEQDERALARLDSLGDLPSPAFAVAGLALGALFDEAFGRKDVYVSPDALEKVKVLEDLGPKADGFSGDDDKIRNGADYGALGADADYGALGADAEADADYGALGADADADYGALGADADADYGALGADADEV